LNCLLVDDSEAFLASAARLLVAQGVRVVGRATCAAEAVRLANDCLPDVALVDIELGPEDGIELAGRLIAAGSCRDVIVISLRDRGELAERIADCGAAGFLRKDRLSAQAVAEVLDSRDGPADLAEARAVRRVATLIAQGAEPIAVFRAIAREAAKILDGPGVGVFRFDERAGTLTKICGADGGYQSVPDGTTFAAADSPLPLSREAPPPRWDDWADVPGHAAAEHRALGLGSVLGEPILVGDELWGYVTAYVADGETLPDCAPRLSEFTELMAIAVANIQARDELRALADAQGALRRVATLVAQGAEARAVFQSVAFEASRMLRVGAVSLVRYNPDTRLFTKIFGTHGDRSAVPDGGSWGLPDCPEGALILETAGPVRIDDWTSIPGPVAARHREQGFGQCVAAPILIDGSIWGHVAAFGEADEVLPPSAQTWLDEFTQLMAAAIANVQVRDELRSLAERQGAALRRVATLVAQQASPGIIFNAVASEASLALGGFRIDVSRCDADGELTLLGTTGPARPSRAARVSSPAVRARPPRRCCGPGGRPGSMTRTRKCSARW
jgi:DNA-binding NarL/FixJ family response regulator